MKWRRWLIVALICLGGAAYFGANQTIEGNRKRASVSTFNKHAGGNSVYADFLNSVSKGSAHIRKRPILYDEDLEGISTLMILSPTNEITSREARIVVDFVNEGGSLILGVHDPEGLARTRHLLEVLGGNATIVPDTHFRNGQSVLLSPKKDTFVFRADETYEFYSSVLIDRNECRGGNFECYVYEVPHGRGKVVLLAGLPFFGNVLIGRQANKQAALRMAASYPSVEIDEYHHFFTDQTFWDLLKRPGFSVPILGSVLGALLLFAFGHSEFTERSQEVGRPESPPRTLHGLSESIVFRVFEKSTAHPVVLKEHRDFLARLFPRKQKELEQERLRVAGKILLQDEFLQEGRRLLTLHKRWMKGEK